MAKDKRLGLVEYCIKTSFAGRLPIGSTIRGMTVGGQAIPDFRIDANGEIILI